MKKAVSILLTLLLVLAMMPAGAIPMLVAAEESAEEVILNVKDFGAVGDGKTDDEAAIWATFESALMDYMAKDIPVTVYFPEGQYGLLNGGLYVYLPRGYGNLTIKGDGADKSTIVYLNEWSTVGSWVALRIYPRITPTSIDEYLHDITIQDLGVYDTDPVKHAWNADEGDPGTEETHGFNIQHCVRATIKNCKAVDVGDECFDMTHCVDSLMTENVVIKNKLVGKGGGSLSVGSGSKNVAVINNLVKFNTNTLDVGHYGIATEALSDPIEDVHIADNTVLGINGWGINIGAPGAVTRNVWIQNNVLTDCCEGGIRFLGTGQTTGAQLLNNHIYKARFGIRVDGADKDGVLVDACTIEEVSSYALSVTSPRSDNTVFCNTTIRNAGSCAIYNAGTDTQIHHMLIDGVGMASNGTENAIMQYPNGGSSEINNSLILNCQNKRAIQGVSKVINTYIDQAEVSGYSSISGADLIQNCRVNRLVNPKTDSVIDGLALYTTADLGTHAINLASASGCTITNCVFTMPSRYAINETTASNNNTITNNICVGGNGIKTVSMDTVNEGNVRAQKGTTEQIVYRIAGGAATVITSVDPTLTEIRIPATLEGCPVTAIDPWAFALHSDLTTVAIPEGVTTIDYGAFLGCSTLTDVRYGGLEDKRPAITVGEENTALFDAAWTYHWENHQYDNACDPDCNDCPVIREVGDHVYDGICDGICNECGFTREVPDHDYRSEVVAPDCENDGYTIHACVGCGDSYTTDEVPATGHLCDNACDPDCNVCGAVRPVPDHEYDNDRDADCNVCGAVREVATFRLGDVNGDGRINNQDLGILQRYLADYEVAINLDAADVKSDGRVNNRDLGLLQQYLTDWDVTFG